MLTRLVAGTDFTLLHAVALTLIFRAAYDAVVLTLVFRFGRVQV